MVLGMAIFSWDTKIGAILDTKYPDSFDLSPDLLNKIYMTHSYDQNQIREELVEIKFNEQIILSYCDKSRVPTVGYELFLTIIEERDKENLFQIKNRILNLAKDTFNKSKEERNTFFIKNVESFFQKSSAKKILLLGRAGTGKTSIKKIIFEGADPKDLLYNPLEPTRGIMPSVYSWLDLKLGLFDSSGQELSFLLENEEEQAIAFENTDIIIYLFDFPMWVAKSSDIIKEIKKIQNIIKKNYDEANLILFVHKIDLISQSMLEFEKKQIEEKIQKELNLPIYFTSIYPDMIYNMYNAFYKILSNFSEETTFLKDVMDEKINDFKKTMCFLTNKNNSIISQSMTQDFNPVLINHSHKLIAQINQNFEDMAAKDNIVHLILSSSKELNIIMNSLKGSKLELKNLICISESLTANKLIMLIGEIKVKIQRYLYFDKKE